MAQSVQKLIPKLVSHLLREHSEEWVEVRRGQISYQLKRGHGYFIIFRTPSLGPKRLVSAHIPTRLPKSEAEWQDLREWMLEEGLGSLPYAKYRYLFVSPKSVSKAQEIMADTDIRVRSKRHNSRLTKRCTRPLAAPFVPHFAAGPGELGRPASCTRHYFS